jgi:hypothetical protein
VEEVFGCLRGEVTDGMLEEDADERIGGWGVREPDELDGWLADHGYVRRVVVTSWEEWLAHLDKSRHGSVRPAFPWARGDGDHRENRR